LRTRAQHRRTNTRLDAQKRKSLREIFVEGFRCTIAIIVPPLSSPIYLGLRALREANDHSLYLRMTSGESRKHFFGGYRFAAIGLPNGQEQLRLLFRSEGKAAAIILREDRD
jgi:hypothetical protein